MLYICARFFLSAVQEKYAKLDPEEQIKKAFTLFDSDGLGKVRRIVLVAGQTIGLLSHVTE